MIQDISHLSQIFPFVALRFIKVNNYEQYIFGWFIIFSSLIAFIDIKLFLFNNIPHFQLYHIYVPIELVILSYILISEFIYTDEQKACILILMLILYGICTYIQIDEIMMIDYMKSMFEYFILSVFSIITLFKLSENNWKFYMIIGILFYSLINLASYPNYHSQANILMNFFFFIAIIK